MWWRAEQDLPESYKVFVHLLDANGVPRAQADVIPQNGARPTWSWLPGEIIADEVVLNLPADLPAGQYRLTTGLYNELNGDAPDAAGWKRRHRVDDGGSWAVSAMHGRLAMSRHESIL